MASNELTPNSEDRIMCVKVGKVKRENLYDMTRKYWKVDINRARRASKPIMVIQDGKIIFKGKVKRKKEHIDASISKRMDPEYIFCAKLKIAAGKVSAE